MFAIAAKEGRYVASCDIEGAYLNANLEKRPLFMRLPRSVVKWTLKFFPHLGKFVNEDGTITTRVIKAMYGTVEAGRLWFEHLRETLINDGFMQNPHDPCVFNKTVEGVQVSVTVYVDDLVITSVERSLVESAKSEIS